MVSTSSSFNHRTSADGVCSIASTIAVGTSISRRYRTVSSKRMPYHRDAALGDAAQKSFDVLRGLCKPSSDPSLPTPAAHTRKQALTHAQSSCGQRLWSGAVMSSWFLTRLGASVCRRLALTRRPILIPSLKEPPGELRRMMNISGLSLIQLWKVTASPSTISPLIKRTTHSRGSSFVHVVQTNSAASERDANWYCADAPIKKPKSNATKRIGFPPENARSRVASAAGSAIRSLSCWHWRLVAYCLGMVVGERWDVGERNRLTECPIGRAPDASPRHGHGT